MDSSVVCKNKDFLAIVDGDLKTIQEVGADQAMDGDADL